MSPNYAEKETFVKYRYVVAVLTFFAFLCVHLLRIHIGVTIVAMVNSKDISPALSSNETCPFPHYYWNDTSSEKKIRQDGFDWDQNTQAHVLGSYSYGLVASYFVAGYFCDVFGAKRMLGLGLFLSALITLLSPVAANHSCIAFAVMRALIGFSQGVAPSCLACILSRWFPKHERTFASGVIRAGSNLGSIIATQGPGFLCNSTVLGGWPSVYYIFGSISMFVCAFWCLLMYEYPTDHAFISAKEKNYILKHLHEEGHYQKPNKQLPWKSILTSLPVWTCALCFFATSWSLNAFINYMPIYLDRILHYNIEENGILSSLHFILAMFGLVISGKLADWLFQRGYLSDTNLRKLYVALGNILSPLLLITITQVGCYRNLITGLLSVGGSLVILPSSGVDIALVNMSPTHAGALTGICSAIGEMSGFISAYIVGALTQNNDTIHQWNLVFYISAAVIFGFSLPFILWGSAEPQSWRVKEKAQDKISTISQTFQCDKK